MNCGTSSTLSTCSMHLATSCPTSPLPLSLTCSTSPQCHLLPDYSSTSPPSAPWTVSLNQETADCAEVYLGSIKPANKVLSRPGQATTLLVSTTIIKSEETDEGNEEGIHTDEESVCLRSLVVSACQCLPWQYNWPGEEEVCAGGHLYNCSLAVARLQEAAGGDCQLGRRLVEQRMRIRLPAGVRQACRCGAGGDRVRHSVRQVGAG